MPANLVGYLDNYFKLGAFSASMFGAFVFALFSCLSAKYLGPLSVITVLCAIATATLPVVGLWLYLT